MILKRSLEAGSDPELEFIHLLRRLILVGAVSVKSILLIIAPGLVPLLRRRRLVSLKSVLLCRNLRSQTTEAPSKGITSAADQVELCKSKSKERVSMLNTYRASC